MSYSVDNNDNVETVIAQYEDTPNDPSLEDSECEELPVCRRLTKPRPPKQFKPLQKKLKRLVKKTARQHLLPLTTLEEKRVAAEHVAGFYNNLRANLDIEKELTNQLTQQVKAHQESIHNLSVELQLSKELNSRTHKDVLSSSLTNKRLDNELRNTKEKLAAAEKQASDFKAAFDEAWHKGFTAGYNKATEVVSISAYQRGLDVAAAKAKARYEQNQAHNARRKAAKAKSQALQSSTPPEA